MSFLFDDALNTSCIHYMMQDVILEGNNEFSSLKRGNLAQIPWVERLVPVALKPQRHNLIIPNNVHSQKKPYSER